MTLTAGAHVGASWTAEDAIVFATSDPSTGLLRVPAGGGQPTVLTRAEASNSGRDHFDPFVLPKGRGVLFTIDAAGATPAYFGEPDLAVLDGESGEQRILVRGASQGTYVESGHLVYAIGNTLWAAPFDIDTMSITGDQVAVVQQLRGRPVEYSVSRNGTLVYVPAPPSTGRALVWIDRDGREEFISWFEELRAQAGGGK